MFDNSEKVRENRLRRVAARRGFKLVKSARRDPMALDYGLWALINVETGGAINPSLAGQFTHSWTLDEVEDHLAA